MTLTEAYFSAPAGQSEPTHKNTGGATNDTAGIFMIYGYFFSKRAAQPPPGCITALRTSFFVTVRLVTL